MIKEPLKASALQHDIVWGDPASNLKAVDKELSALPGDVDIIVLPEMFSTGFLCDKDAACRLAEPMDGTTMEMVRKWSRQNDAAICGSFIARDNDRIFNRAFFITPSGEETFYDKHHLFTMSGEDSVYTRGSSAMPVVTFRGWNVAFAVCFDLRFPVWLRNRGKAYDLLIVMANWPDSRAYAWEQLLIARAIENQAYVIGCNRSGSDKFGVYSGTSHIIEPKGRNIETDVTPVAVEAQLSMESLVGFRNKFPVYLEGDNFELL